MDPNFWLRLHGASTHFPIVLLGMSVAFDLAGTFWCQESRRGGFRSAGFFSALIAVLASLAAVASGVVISHGKAWGTGTLLRHHQFVWPGFALALALVCWRLFARDRFTPPALRVYLGGMALSSALIFLAAYFGGELALGLEGTSPTAATRLDPKQIASGRHLFLMNCAHCHGDDATGDEGPDLHNLHKTDERLSAIIHNGIKGEMPRFDKKFHPEDVNALVAYLKSLGAKT